MTLLKKKLNKISHLIKERCTLLSDVWPNSYFFFEELTEIDIDSVKPKWNADKDSFFKEAVKLFQEEQGWVAETLENKFKQLAAEKNIKPGEVMLPLRIMLVGKKNRARSI